MNQTDRDHWHFPRTAREAFGEDLQASPNRNSRFSEAAYQFTLMIVYGSIGAALAVWILTA